MKPRLAFAIGLALLPAWPAPARAVLVSDLTVHHSNGQTFITWTGPPAAGNTFRVYRSETALPPGAGPALFDRLGTTGDSSACDRRFSVLRGNTYAYVIPVEGELAPEGGLYVHTCDQAGPAYYAVTCQASGGTEDTTLVPGLNQTAFAVPEWMARPEPVYQRQVTIGEGIGAITASVYTLWTSHRATPMFPPMSSRESIAYDCAVSLNPGGSSHALMFHAHTFGGNFLQLNWGSTTPGEYVLTMDDHYQDGITPTYWFGYHEDFNPGGPPIVPTSGNVEDYTMRRVVFTLEWARRTFPVDTTRVYVMGGSMGAIGGTLVTLRRPDLIAAAMVIQPVFDFSYLDPDVGAGFSEGGYLRLVTDRMWGEAPTGLLRSDGTPVYDLLNANRLAEGLSASFVPPIVAFVGRSDRTVGWTEKPRFFATMQAQRAGGMFYFDTRTHPGGYLAQWYPLQSPAYLYRFRSNLSFPAFSHCSSDQDAGNGEAADGDSIGTINGPLEWILYADQPSIWSVLLATRALDGRFVSFPAPESLTVDVTPRRTQNFRATPLTLVSYRVQRTGGSAIVAEGLAFVNGDGVVTIPEVPVYRTGSWLTITPAATTAAGLGSGPGCLVGTLPNPLVTRSELVVRWSRPGAGRVELFDVAGRRRLQLLDAEVTPGESRLELDPRVLPSGVYFLRAALGREVQVRRVAIAR